MVLVVATLWPRDHGVLPNLGFAGERLGGGQLGASRPQQLVCLGADGRRRHISREGRPDGEEAAQGGEECVFDFHDHICLFLCFVEVD
jgi:hypothetical protein